MQKLKKIYRSSYAGESIVTELNLSHNEWNPVTEFVPNSVSTHIAQRAICIGNGQSRLMFNLSLIARHRVKSISNDKIRSYGCNALYRDFAPDFLVARGDDIITEIAESDYCTNNIVYTTADSVLKHPGKFYLIPQNVPFDAGALAAYMAGFDGHKKVYLLGYDQYDDPGQINNVYKNTNGYPTDANEQNNRFLSLSLQHVIQTYDDVEFIRVMPLSTWWQPEILRPLLNYRQISYKDFIIEADIS